MTSRLKHHDIEKWRQLSHDIVIENIFCEDKKPRNRVCNTEKTATSRFQDQKNATWDSKTKTLRKRKTETTKPRHCYPKVFFQWTKSHQIEIPRLKNRNIKIPRPKPQTRVSAGFF